MHKTCLNKMEVYINLRKKVDSYKNLHFLIIIFVNLIGVIPYIFFGKKHSIEEAEEFDQTEAPS